MVGLAKIAMDWLQDPLSWLLVASVVLVVLRRGKAAPLPPGPRPLPIIGNMLMMDQLTHRGLAALAKRYGGLLHLRLGKLHVIAVSTPEYAREVLQTQDVAFSNRPATLAIAYLAYGRADMAFAHYGPFWRQMRKLCVMKLFSRRRPETWAAVREESAALIRAVARRSGEAVDLGELIFNLTKNVTFRAAFGVDMTRDVGKQGDFIGILQEYSKLLSAFNIGDFIPWLRWADPQGVKGRLRTARAGLDKFIDKIIDEHMKRGKNPDETDADMVDAMLAYLPETKPTKGAADDDLQNTLSLTRDNIKAMIMINNLLPSLLLTPLDAAVGTAYTSCAKLLIQAGANVNDVNNSLARAATEGLTEVVKCLLEAGANPSRPDECGRLPIELAALYGTREDVELLFPVTSPIPNVVDWSVVGIINHAKLESLQLMDDDAVNMRKSDLKQQADEAFEKQDYTNASVLYTKQQCINIAWFRADPSDRKVLANRSRCWLRLGDGQKALEDAIKCKRSNKNWAEAHHRQGEAHMLLKEYEKACEVLTRGLELDPENDEMDKLFWEAMELKKK